MEQGWPKPFAKRWPVLPPVAKCTKERSAHGGPALRPRKAIEAAVLAVGPGPSGSWSLTAPARSVSLADEVNAARHRATQTLVAQTCVVSCCILERWWNFLHTGLGGIFPH
ncbi:unnamed protein product [Durusdinium trenchii]|uniref:Uncharacterized protein n=1 Tax=Durusdinium trenchii TaxID=1381693 RepID=A0ABP0SWB1_9DINO